MNLFRNFSYFILVLCGKKIAFFRFDGICFAVNRKSMCLKSLNTCTQCKLMHKQEFGRHMNKTNNIRNKDRKKNFFPSHCRFIIFIIFQNSKFYFISIMLLCIFAGVYRIVHINNMCARIWTSMSVVRRQNIHENLYLRY